MSCICNFVFSPVFVVGGVLHRIRNFEENSTFLEVVQITDDSVKKPNDWIRVEPDRPILRCRYRKVQVMLMNGEPSRDVWIHRSAKLDSGKSVCKELQEIASNTFIPTMDAKDPFFLKFTDFLSSVLKVQSQSARQKYLKIANYAIHRLQSLPNMQDGYIEPLASGLMLPILHINRISYMAFCDEDDPIIGQGTFKKVYRGVRISPAHPVENMAIAIAKGSSDNRKRIIQNEAKMSKIFGKSLTGLLSVEAIYLQDEDHDNVAQITGFFVMPLCEGSLFSLFSRQRSFWLSFVEKLDIACEITEGLAYIHRNNCAHRDIKPDNILLSKIKNVWHGFIGDFGTITDLDRASLQTREGSLGYLAPEAVKRTTANLPLSPDERLKNYQKLDIWALGLTLLYLFTQQYPDWNGSKNPTELEMTIASLTKSHISECVTNILNAELNKLGRERNIFVDVGAVILRCFEKNPIHRPSSSMILNILKMCIPSSSDSDRSSSEGELPEDGSRNPFLHIQ